MDTIISVRKNLFLKWGKTCFLVYDIIRHLRLSGRKLSVVNIKPFLSLEVLDLSNNNLTVVGGLEVLIRFFSRFIDSNLREKYVYSFNYRLKYLNLFGNPKLSLSETLPRLQKTNSLESISFGVSSSTNLITF